MPFSTFLTQSALKLLVLPYWFALDYLSIFLDLFGSVGVQCGVQYKTLELLSEKTRGQFNYPSAINYGQQWH